MSDRPDLDEAIQILQSGGFNITGGKYAPKEENGLVKNHIHAYSTFNGFCMVCGKHFNDSATPKENK